MRAFSLTLLMLNSTFLMNDTMGIKLKSRISLESLEDYMDSGKNLETFDLDETIDDVNELMVFSPAVTHTKMATITSELVQVSTDDQVHTPLL